MRRLISLLVFAALGVFGAVAGPASPACACSCAPAEEAEYTARASLVFDGTVVKIDEPRGGPARSSLDPIEVTFVVGTVHKGTADRRITLETARSEASCGFSFDGGRRYKVYARTVDGVLTTGLCDGTKDLGPGGEEAIEYRREPEEKRLPLVAVIGAGALGLGLAGLGVGGALLWTRRRRQKSA
jgi:hypothetical protein